MKYYITRVLLAVMVCLTQGGLLLANPGTVQSTGTIAFGSCLRQWLPQPVWQGITSVKPQAFIFLGDNVYTDVGHYRDQKEPARIGQAYQDQNGNLEYQQFIAEAKRQRINLFAVWDDHDYGVNDGGSEYPFKKQSRDYFRAFFDLPEALLGSNSREGIYQEYKLDINDLVVQLLLLDTRSFRSPLNKSESSACGTKTVPEFDMNATVLGEDQWKWLEEQLKEPADIRIIASSIQVIPDQHCYEKWANFPREKTRLFNLLNDTNANGVLIVSGDRHLAEISVLKPPQLDYPLYEITSSGLNSAMGAGSQGASENNRYRVTPGNVLQDNFGAIQVVTRERRTQLLLQIRSKTGDIVQQISLPLDQLSPGP